MCSHCITNVSLKSEYEANNASLPCLYIFSNTEVKKSLHNNTVSCDWAVSRRLMLHRVINF